MFGEQTFAQLRTGFSPVFVGLKCAQASRVSVYLSAFDFLSVFFFFFFLTFVVVVVVVVVS